MDLARHEVLLKDARAGDADAINQVLALCQPDIRRYAQRTCMISDVDDAIQESLIILSRRISSLRAVAALSSWLFRVVRHECHRMARKALRVDPWDDERAETYLSVHSSEELRHDLAAALESLPPHYREILMLRDIEELTINEIAAQLGESRAATKSRLHRARQLTREYLLG
ncbi:RNA polymerase sigma factor [Dyella acidisoli]|uniref:RNA polymerase sigma24 factor n=1 Tax=Dyella acidisoli TaxID=1867834 RepID=A0ABQ5XTF1_9GAMM|nr:sigma-70 family RNA polymerase sigma factor [Dyella acidisoli]GLQ94449.1 RNA polymerase sigma24 factor [Dyella acidisoli]